MPPASRRLWTSLGWSRDQLDRITFSISQPPYNIFLDKYERERCGIGADCTYPRMGVALASPHQETLGLIWPHDLDYQLLLLLLLGYLACR